MKYTVTIPLLATLLLLSCAGDKTPEKSLSEPVAVQVADAGTGDQAPFFSASGTITAASQANLGTRMMGYVRDIPVKVGDPVRSGQLLLSLDNADLQARMAQTNAGIAEAEAAFSNAEKDYMRYRELFSDQSATQKELDDMTAGYRMAKARLEAARQMKNEVAAQFAYTRIRAPFNGVVTNIFAETGDLANPGQPLVAVETPGTFEVEARIPENEIGMVRRGDTVSVLVKATGKRLGGRVAELSNSARNTGGQYLATIQLLEQDDALRTGMYATLQFPREGTGTREDSTVLIPMSSLVRRGQLAGVYTISQEGTALLRWLRLGRAYGDQVEVLSGLQNGETYIVSSGSKLYNGVPVRLQ